MAETKKTKKVQSDILPKADVKTDDRYELPQLLIQLADNETRAKLGDDKLDRHNDIVELLNGTRIDLKEFIRKRQEVISEILADYEPIFPQAYYKNIFRLNGWPLPEGNIYQKPHLVAKYTNEVIYGRFDKDVLTKLQVLNPYVGVFGKREYKHFQYLTQDGKQWVVQFINDSITLMEQCSTWIEFREKYFVQYNVPYQTELFE